MQISIFPRNVKLLIWFVQIVQQFINVSMNHDFFPLYLISSSMEFVHPRWNTVKTGSKIPDISISEKQKMNADLDMLWNYLAVGRNCEKQTLDIPLQKMMYHILQNMPCGLSLHSSEKNVRKLFLRVMFITCREKKTQSVWNCNKFKKKKKGHTLPTFHTRIPTHPSGICYEANFHIW